MNSILESLNGGIDADLVVIGATGDLSRRKLFPALYHLWADGVLDPGSRIYGVALSDLDQSSFREEMREAVSLRASKGCFDEDTWSELAQRIFYFGLKRSEQTSEKQSGYAALAKDLLQKPRARVFYLAVSCELYGKICEELAALGLIDSQTRIVLEKPIGKDLASAHAVNRDVAKSVPEEQIYRIDHYLGKETVQNLFALRFGNVLFEPLWKASVIDHVQISVAESVGVEGRQDFYNGTGALRDMVQNHVLQLLCLVAMEVPNDLNSTAVRDEKIKVLRSLERIAGGQVRKQVVRGQYIRDRHGKLPGYVEELGYSSSTETFVAMRVNVNNWRWKGVPFYIRTGKRLSKRSSKIIVQFKPVPHVVFGSSKLVANRLELLLQPDDGIKLSLMAKKPGQGMVLQESHLALDFHKTSETRRPGAYERLLRDVLRGDSTLFMRRDEVEEAWRWIDPILEEWKGDDRDLRTYESSTMGPERANSILASGVEWADELS